MPTNLTDRRGHYLDKYTQLYPDSRTSPPFSKALHDVALLDETVEVLLKHMAETAYGADPTKWPSVMRNARTALMLTRTQT